MRKRAMFLEFIKSNTQNTIKLSIYFLTLLLISACGGSSGNPSTNLGGTPTTETSINDPSFPYSGTVTLDEYNTFSVNNSYIGIIDLTLSPLSKKRLLNGSLPRRHSSGALTFRQTCGQDGYQIMLLDVEESIADQITPCSETMRIERFAIPEFRYSSLSPGKDQVVVEARYVSSGDFRLAVFVYDIATSEMLAFWDNFAAPMWLRDGRLLLASGNGFFITNVGQETPDKFPDGLSSSVDHPALHPTKDMVAFEFNQQIWTMNLDGTEIKEQIFGGSKLLFPTWSPDGNTLLYLQSPRASRIDRALYFTDLATKNSFSLLLIPVLSKELDTITINGPISWFEQ